MGKSNLRKSNHIMKKTFTAVAVLGALSGATLAADVTLYGVIDTGFTYQHTEGGDDSFAMTSGSYAGPRFGFKGTEKLGDDLTVGFILEEGFNSDTGAQAEDGKIFSRESQIYLTGDWGTLGFGRVGGFSSGMSSLSWYWDFEPFETGYVDAGIQASQVNVWNVHSNTIYYVSPTFAGAKLGVQYSLTNEADTEEDRWADNSKWLNVALRWDGNNVKVIGAFEAEFYGDSGAWYSTDDSQADTKNWDDAFSYKLAATWTPGGGATTLYAGLNYFTNNRRMSDANWNEYDFDSDLLKTSSTRTMRFPDSWVSATPWVRPTGLLRCSTRTANMKELRTAKTVTSSATLWAWVAIITSATVRWATPSCPGLRAKAGSTKTKIPPTARLLPSVWFTTFN